MQISPYLNFNGQCEEAFRFYEKVLGGTIIHMQTHGDSPMAEHTPKEQQNLIIHARLQFGDNVLMASDSPPEYFQTAQGFFVSIMVDTPEEADRIYGQLSQSGQIVMELQETFWATRFAMFKDRFGTPWMINCERSAS